MTDFQPICLSKPMSKPPDHIVSRIMRKLVFQDSGCWKFHGATDRNGYPRIKWDSVNRLAHRMVYAYFVRPLEEGETVHHECRNIRCCNPTHLAACSHEENVAMGNADRNRPLVTGKVPF